MRAFDPATDMPIIETASRQEMTLANVRRHLQEAGITWNYNNELDQAITEVWDVLRGAEKGGAK